MQLRTELDVIPFKPFMKFFPFLIIPLLFAPACSNEYADSPERWKIRKPVVEVTPTPGPGNPYVTPEKVVRVPQADLVL